MTFLYMPLSNYLIVRRVGLLANQNEAEVAIPHLGVISEFFKPGLTRVDEYKEVIRPFPHDEFKDELFQVMCDSCGFKLKRRTIVASFTLGLDMALMGRGRVRRSV